ncbi:hypothetical protein PKCEKB_PKCEKB_11195, partial [Dysosmobacter welbionis]
PGAAGGDGAAPAEGSEQAGQAALRLRRGCGDPQLSGRVSGDAVEHHHKGAGQCGRRPQGAGKG